MKIKHVLVALTLLIASGSTLAVPITNLIVSDTNIQVGENFGVDVWIDNDVVGEQLLSFGLDVQPVSPLLNYTGFTLPIDFTDVSFGPQNVSGLAFPGITGTNILLATLMFQAVDVGVANIEVEGLFDGIFLGLFYENSGFDIAAQTTITIEAAPVSMPSPNAWLFVLVFAIGMTVTNKRYKFFIR